MTLSLLVAVAAGVGAVLRYLVDREVSHRVRSQRPWGTFVVNVSGSLVLGLVTGWSLHHGLSAHAGTILAAGFAGGYTTLSTWAFETAALQAEGDVRGAALNLTGSLLAAVAAAALGLGIALL